MKNVIVNQYKGKKPSEIWKAWDNKQRMHFLEDHNFMAGHWSDDWLILPEDIKQAMVAHAMMGQYKEGGAMYSVGGMIDKLNNKYSFKELFTK